MKTFTRTSDLRDVLGSPSLTYKTREALRSRTELEQRVRLRAQREGPPSPSAGGHGFETTLSLASQGGVP